MNTEQYRLLEENNLTFDMICALANLVDGKTLRGQNRSYKALYRRGLATENFQVTQDGLNLYEQYCSKGKSVPEYMREIDEQVSKRMKTEKAHESEFAGFLQSFDVDRTALNAINKRDANLRKVIESWPKLPYEFQMLIAHAAVRIADQEAARRP